MWTNKQFVTLPSSNTWSDEKPGRTLSNCVLDCQKVQFAGTTSIANIGNAVDRCETTIPSVHTLLAGCRLSHLLLWRLCAIGRLKSVFMSANWCKWHTANMRFWSQQQHELKLLRIIYASWKQYIETHWQTELLHGQLLQLFAWIVASCILMQVLSQLWKI